MAKRERDISARRGNFLSHGLLQEENVKILSRNTKQIETMQNKSARKGSLRNAESIGMHDGWRGNTWYIHAIVRLHGRNCAAAERLRKTTPNNSSMILLLCSDSEPWVSTRSFASSPTKKENSTHALIRHSTQLPCCRARSRTSGW